jgi:hypothetical protein
LLVQVDEIYRRMASDLLRCRIQGRAPDRPDIRGSDMSFSRAGQGLMISTVTVASP